MFKNILDRYYFVLLQQWDDVDEGRDRLYYKVPGVIAVLVFVNAVSVFLFFVEYLPFFNLTLFVVVWTIIDTILMILISLRYNKKRRAELREKYDTEDETSIRHDKIVVYAYQIFSIAFFVLAVFYAGRNTPP